ncbi:uncharacterized protein [Haliotis asinina]|uniref:uncharacterized protein n=1 Tax=Haliotis asinina TaxID=109174 RepID=UPI003531A330
MEEKVYTVQEIIEYFEGRSGERFNSEIERFARGNAQNARAFRNLMRERRSADPQVPGTGLSNRGELGVTKDGPSREPVPTDHAYSVLEAHREGVPTEDDIMVEEDNTEFVTRGVQDLHTNEGDMENVSEDPSVAVFDTSDAGVEHISGVTGGDVDNSTVVGVVKGGMRNKQAVIDSDICITGSKRGSDGAGEAADDKPKDVVGVAGGAVKDSTVVGEVHGGMDNEQTIENSKIYSDGSFGGNLQFLDLNIRQRDDCEGQEGGVQSFKDCIIDLRKPDDASHTDKPSDDAECSQTQTGSASSAAGLSGAEPGDDTDDQDMQKKIREVKEQAEREEEERRLMQEKQAAMEEQLQTEQRERQHMQAEMQRISNEQRQHAAYRGHPNPVVVNPALASGGFVVAPAVARVVYVKPKTPNKGTGLLKNIKQFINDAKK